MKPNELQMKKSLIVAVSKRSRRRTASLVPKRISLAAFKRYIRRKLVERWTTVRARAKAAVGGAVAYVAAVVLDGAGEVAGVHLVPRRPRGLERSSHLNNLNEPMLPVNVSQYL